MVDVHRGRHSYGRTQGQAPEVDGRVVLPRTSVAPGQVVPVRITGTSTYDLRAELI
jgi:tRNA A37 methylthiotransferase MiaB